MNNTIWMYWENKKGSKKPEYLDLCLETIVKNSPNYEVILLNEKSVYEYLPNLRKDLHKIVEIAHRADYIRANIIYEFGGIWLDSDLILLKEINISEALKKYDFVGSSKIYGQPSIWFFGANPKCEILKKWIDKMNEKLDKKFSQVIEITFRQKKYKYLSNFLKSTGLKSLSKKMQNKYKKKLLKLSSFSWSEIGYDILWDLFNGYKYYNIDFVLFAPLEYNKWEKFLSDKYDIKKLINQKTIAVILYNKFMFKKLKNYTREELLKSNMLISQAYRIALSK